MNPSKDPAHTLAMSTDPDIISKEVVTRVIDHAATGAAFRKWRASLHISIHHSKPNSRNRHEHQRTERPRSYNHPAYRAGILSL